MHLGDRAYIDSTVVATQRTGYQTEYADGSAFAALVKRTPFLCVWSDHDYGGNNEDGDLPDKGNSLQVWKEYTPYFTLPNPSNGIWQSLVLGNVEVFVVDTRYNRGAEGSRWPDAGPGTYYTTQGGSGGATLVLPSGDFNGFDNGHLGAYCEITTGSGTYVRRVTAHVGSTRTVTLNASVPGLTTGDDVYFQRISLLDKDGIANDQVDWLVSGINASTKRWKILASDVVWNPTFTGSGSSDSWGGYDFQQLELRYLQQHITADNVIVLTADRHTAALDDGTNSGWPEGSSSPFNHDIFSVGGTWSHGTYGANNYGRLVIDGSAHTATLSIRDVDGNNASGTTPVVVVGV
jgi:phosphodiesterase/alkaline phosphatase D-like protein